VFQQGRSCCRILVIFETREENAGCRMTDTILRGDTSHFSGHLDTETLEVQLARVNTPRQLALHLITRYSHTGGMWQMGIQRAHRS
jgi:hypothetical protein